MSQNNPFTEASNSPSTTSNSSGYQGTIFNLPPSNSVFTPQSNVFQEHTDTEDHLFASHAPFLEQDNQNNQNNQLAFPQPSSSVFNQTPNQQQPTPAQANSFGQSTSQPISNLFGSSTSQQQEKQPMSHMFGQSRPLQNHASSSIFGSSGGQPQQAQPSSNIFGQFSSQSNQPKTNFFHQNAAVEPQSQPVNITSTQFDDSMQTSPDNSPQKIDLSKQGVFSFLNSQAQNQSDKTTTTPSQGGSLFSRITRPTSAPAASTASSQGGISSTDQQSSTSPTEPTEDAAEKPGSNANSPSANPNIFGKSTANGLAISSLPQMSTTASTIQAEKRAIGSRPFATPNLAKPSSPDTQVAKGNPFASLKVPQPTPSSPKPTSPAKLSSTSPQNPGDTGFNIKGISAASSLPASNQKREVNITSSPSRTFRNMGTPPTVPAHFTEAQKQQMVTGYRLRSLDMGLKKYMLGSGFFSEPLLITRFYEEKKEEILAAQGLPKEGLAGSKRKSADNEKDLDGNGPNKKSRSATSFFGSPSKNTPQMPLVPRPAANGSTPNTPLFGQPAPDNSARTCAKRAADEDLVKANANEINGTGKKACCDDNVSYPSLPSTSQPPQGSETSNIFKSILSKPDDKSSGSLLTALVNGTSHTGPSAPKLSVESSKSSATSTANNLSSNNKSSYSAVSSTFQTRPETLFSSSGTASSYLSQSKPTLSSSDATNKSTVFSPSFQSKPSSTRTFADSAPTNPFTIKPVTSAVSSSDTVKATTSKPPAFGTGAPVDFLARFGKAAEETAKKEKEKRKAEDFDLDEDDGAEWDRKDVEEQRAKKQKIVEAAKGKVSKYAPGSGFVLAEENDSPQLTNPGSSAPPKFRLDAAKPTPSTAGGGFGFGTLTSSTGLDTSLFPNVKAFGAQNAVNKNNIFGHLSDAESGAERSQTGDADDEDTDSGAESEGVNGEDASQGANEKHRRMQSTDSATNGSLKISKNSGGNNVPKCGPSPNGALAKGYACIEKLLQSPTPEGLLPERVTSDRNETKKSPFKISSAIVPGDFTPQSSPSRGTTSSSFNQATTNPASSVFGQSSSKTVAPSPFGVLGSPGGDHTWKQDSPIKFGGTDSTPGLSITPATPTKSASAEQKGSASSGLGGLFGAAKPATIDASSKPATSFFGAGTSANKGPDAGFGFGFGGPPKSAANILAPPPGLTSNATSRANSPGVTTGGESANDSIAEGAEGETEHHEQINLAAGGPGEENEDILFEVRAKALMYDSEKKEWPIQGLGPLRVLKDRKTGKTRILLRQDPSGRIVLNAALMSAMSYDYSKPKGVKMGVASDDGKLSTWMIKVGKEDDATRLSSVLEGNKTS